MFRPKYPTAPVPTGTATRVVTPTAVQPVAAVEPASCGHHAPAPPAPASSTSARLTPGTVALLVGGGTAAVLVVGAVLVSMLLAVAITAASVAVCALVIRSLLNGQHQR